MFRNYLAAALRNLVRNRLYAAINIIGLAVGFAAALLITLYVRDEFSYDKWIPGHERTYLLTETLAFAGRTPGESHETPVALAAKLKLDYPEIKSIARLVRAGVSLRRGGIEANETLYWADPEFFDVLSLPVAFGDPKTALAQPDGIVLTRRMARKYFGRDNPVGETIEIDRKHPMTVTAILEDLPSNTHLAMEIIASGNAQFSFLAQQKADPDPPGAWNSTGWTYLRLAPNADAAKIGADMPNFLDRNMKQAIAPFSRATLHLTPVSLVHMSPENGGTAMKPTTDPLIAYALSATGVLILVIAGINFVNLMTARAVRRAIEVGVRKSSGAARKHLVIQFLGESLLYAVVSGALALIVAALVFPAFSAFLDRTIALRLSIGLVAAVLGVVVFAGTIAGFYPALVMSAFRPASVLKGAAVRSGGSGQLRQSLVVLQFALLISLVAGVAVIYRQSSFALHDGLRLDKDQVLLVATACKTVFLDRIRALPGVRGAACSQRNGLELVNSNGTVHLGDGTGTILAYFPVDVGYLELYGLKPLAGRFFDRGHGADVVSFGTGTVFPSVVINETAMRNLGFKTPEAAIGQTIFQGGAADPPSGRSEIIGVVRDFSFDSIYNLVAPSIYFVAPPRFQWLTIKLTGRNLPETLTAVDQAWKETGEPRPILRLFLDQEVQGLYLGIQRQSRLFSAFSGIALLIAALGLFGLSAFTTESRTKEIGVRKVMGASGADILRLLLWEFAKPVLWANVIAWPVGYVVMHRWLEGFAYHVTLEPWIFLAASAAALAIALITVSGHALLVARSQPVAALRYE